MSRTKNFLSALLCVIFCVSISLTVFAASSDTTITVSNISAMPGDTVVVDVEISNNPGIMAMAFCITYDNDALTYVSYEKGYLSSYTIKDHSDKGHISVVNVESSDKSNDGKIISVVFEVKEKASPGRHVITIANSNREKYGTKLHNSFSNSKQQFVVPLVTAGGITVPETCENSGHKYSDWNIINDANCTETGLKNRTCARCQIVDEATIPVAHDFESDWTIDKVATPNEDGIMSRHCKLCDAVTDKINFSYEEIGGDDTDNTSSDDASSDDASSGDTSSDSASEDGASNYSSSENSYPNTSNENTSENDASDNQSNTHSQSVTQSNSNQTEKPVIDNVVGEKVPLSEVEKFKDYQQNIKPNLENNSSNEEASSDETYSSSTKSDNSDTTTGAIQNDDNTISQSEKSSYFTSPTGIAMIVICLLISIGIIIISIVLIVRRKKAE